MDAHDFLVLKTNFLAELNDAYLFIHERLERVDASDGDSLDDLQQVVEDRLAERWEILRTRLYKIPEDVRQQMESLRAATADSLPSHEELKKKYDRIFAHSLPDGQSVPASMKEHLVAFERKILKVVTVIDAIQG